MLDEQQTLKILGWTLGTVCIGTLVLSACWARCRAASMNCGSLSVTSACKGVLVRLRRTVQTSRLGASKVAIDGYGFDRRHMV